MPHEVATSRLLHADPSELPTLLMTYAVPDAQKAFITAGAWANKLVKKAPVKAAVAAMIAARQLYAVAYHEVLEQVAAESPPPDPMTADALVMSAMHAASEAFDINTLIGSMVGSVMPWIGDVADRKNAEDAAVAQKEMEDNDKLRRSVPLEIGFRYDPELEEAVLPRDRSLVLAGWRPAVVFAIDQIVNAVLASRRDGFLSTVVRLQQDQPRRGDENVYLIRLGRQKWEGCCNTSTALPKIGAEFIAPQMTHPADLVVCDDLPRCVTNGFRGRPSGAVAGDAHKRLKDWAKRDGAGVVAGVPFDVRGDVDVFTPEWEQVRTFATVRPVRVIEQADNLDPGKYRVVVGRAAHYWDVDKAVLDDYRGSGLIIPGENP